MQSNRAMRWNQAMIAIIAWFALLLQLYIMLPPASAGSHAIFAALVNYFSFFTILTNLLLALTLSFSLFLPATVAGRFFSSATVQAGIALYITVVGLVYAVLLRSAWNPTGAAKVADVLLHDVVPVTYAVYWFIFAPKGMLRWKDAVIWLAYPLIYMGYTLVHGAFSGWYPYYFIDIGVLGISHALLNAGKLLLGFLAGGLLVVVIGRFLDRKVSRPS